MPRKPSGGSTRRIPVEDLGPKPNRKGTELLRALTGSGVAPTTPVPPKATGADTRGSKGLLSAIFRDAKGRPIDMTRMDRGRRGGRAPWWILILLILVGAAVAGATLLNRPGKFANASVGVDIALPDSATSGAPFELTITVRNDEVVALKATELTLQYPTGFTFESSDPDPTNDAHQAWDLGSIASGGSKAVTVRGVLLGSIGDPATFIATASYSPANFSSTFTTVRSGTVTVGSSRLELGVDAPASVVPDRAFTSVVTVTNGSSEDLPPVVLTVDPPDTFTAESTEPESTDTNRWTIGPLGAGKKATVKLTGKLSGSAGASAQFTWRASVQDGRGGLTPQTELNQILTLVNPAASVSVSVNGSSADGTLTPGDALAVHVAFANNSDVEIAHATLSVSVDGSGADWSTLEDPAGGKRSGSTLTWTESQLEALKAFKPGDRGELNFTVGTRADLSVESSSDRNPFVTVSARLTPESGDATPAAPVTRRYATRATLVAEARYTSADGETVGSGPLPPKVGQGTVYRILWTLGSTLNDVRDGTVTAVLPAGVEFEGRDISAGSGTLAYDPVTRAVTWTVPKLPAGAGTFVPNLFATFAVRLTPTADQVGTSPTLLGTSTLTGTDDFAQLPVALTVEALTTVSTTDPSMAGKGTVTSS